MIKDELKIKIIDALIELQKQRGVSGAQFGRMIGVSSSQWSRLKRGERDGVLKDERYLTIAREQGIELSTRQQWNTVKTPAFEYFTTVFGVAQHNSVSKIIVDLPDLGKTHAAKHYEKTHRGVYYIDCSQVKTKQLFVRQLAKKVGTKSVGRYSEVYDDLCYFLNSMDDKMLIILDEAGDMKYDAFLELKALWNAVEDAPVGWILMGADCLRVHIEKVMANEKVGYRELFSRYGSDYIRASPIGTDEMEEYRKHQAKMVAMGNKFDGMDVQKVIGKNGHSLRKLKDNIKMMRGRIA